jgi:hypothetical protein
MDNQINKLYDIIVQKYEDYTNYNKIVEKEKEQIKEKDKLLASQFFKDNEENPSPQITEKIKGLIIEKKQFIQIYSQDAQLLFYNLYTLVESYIQLDNVPTLPKKITELCEEYSHIAPKTIMVAEKDKLQERVKGTIENLVKSTIESGEMDKILEVILNQMKQQNPQD